jgi:hypothetical protein
MLTPPILSNAKRQEKRAFNVRGSSPSSVPQKENLPPLLSPKKLAIRSPIFLLVRLAHFSFSSGLSPLAKNRAAQRTLVKATPHSGLQFKQITLVNTFFTPLGVC